MPIHRAVTFGADAAAAVNAVLLERACRTELLAAGAGGPRLWSDENETHFKREQVWNRPQLDYAEVCVKPRICGDGLRWWGLLVDFSA